MLCSLSWPSNSNDTQAPDYLKFTQTPLSTPPEESSSPVVSSKETSPTDDTPDYVQVYDEPLHVTVLENDYVRVMKVGCPAETETMYHRHAQHSFFLFFKHTQVRCLGVRACFCSHNTHVFRKGMGWKSTHVSPRRIVFLSCAIGCSLCSFPALCATSPR